MSIATTQRLYFPHGSHRTIGMTGRLESLQVYRPAAESFTPAARICLVGRPLPGELLDPLGELVRYMEIACQTHVGCLTDGGVWAEIDDPDDLACMVLCGPVFRLSGSVIAAIQRHWQRGGGVVGIRTSERTLHSWPEMDAEFFGCRYKGQHADRRRPEVEPLPRDTMHPVLYGVERFVSRGRLHRTAVIADEAQVLLRGVLPDRNEPVAWVRDNARGRAFYTSLGHAADFLEPDFLRLVANAIRWASRP